MTKSNRAKQERNKSTRCDNTKGADSLQSLVHSSAAASVTTSPSTRCSLAVCPELKLLLSKQKKPKTTETPYGLEIGLKHGPSNQETTPLKRPFPPVASAVSHTWRGLASPPVAVWLQCKSTTYFLCATSG